MPISISFGGFGFTFSFALGVAYELKKQFNIDWSKVLVYGISSGNMAGLALLIYSPDEIMKALNEGLDYLENKKGKRPFYNRDDLEYFINTIPKDTYLRIKDNYAVGVTSKNKKPDSLRAPFSSEEDLKYAIRCSCNIPFLTSSGTKYTDGGFSHKGSIIDKNTIKIGLRRKTLDISLNINFPLEAVSRSRDELMDLFEKGRRSVIDNKQTIHKKIIDGMKTPGKIEDFVPF